jgi:hypothetical protein
MTEHQLSMKASKFRQLWSKLHEMEGNRHAPSFPKGQHEASQFLITLSRVGISNEAVEYTATTSVDDPDGITPGYRLRPEFDWENGAIVVGSLEWADFTGAEGLISSLERVTGIPEGDEEPFLQGAAVPPLDRRQHRPGQNHQRRYRR